MWKLFLADLKMLARNRQATFWALAFPLMFTIIFGLFFGKNSSLGSVDLIDNSNSQISQGLKDTLTKTNAFNIIDATDLDKAKSDMSKSTISAIIVIPDSFGKMPNGDTTLSVIYDQGNAQVGSALTSYINGYLTQINYQIQNAKPIYSVNVERTSNRELTYFDFVLAGVLGLALMNGSIIGIAISMAKYREDKILKRITTTPVKGWQFILAEVFSRLVVNIIQIALILSVGHFFFNGHIYGNIAVLVGIAMLGALLFQLMGFAIASLSKTTDSAQGMATSITIPMMFLAGVFFPIDSLPKWLYSFVQFLPLAPLLRMIRSVSLEAASPFIDPKNIIILMGWIFVMLIFCAYKFRLSDE